MSSWEDVRKFIDGLKVRKVEMIFSTRHFLQKTNKWILFTTMKPQVDLFILIFWRKLKTQKRHFEIIWPLERLDYWDISPIHTQNVLGIIQFLKRQTAAGVRWQKSSGMKCRACHNLLLIPFSLWTIRFGFVINNIGFSNHPYKLYQLNWDSQQGRDRATSGHKNKSLVSSNLNSNLLRFHCVRSIRDTTTA